MILIPYEVTDGTFNLFIGLEDANLERLRQFDPAQVAMDLLPEEWRTKTKKLHSIIVGYVLPDDHAKIEQFIREDKLDELLRYLSRGFKFRPELGDNDDPYGAVKKETSP